MSQIDDLAALIAPTDSPAVGFRQGTIVSWNSTTGENEISVGGSILTNISILNTGEAIALKAGHTVGLLTFNGSWFILGRITPPNDPNFAGASLAFGSGNNSASNFTLAVGTPTTKVSVALTVPAWADEAAIIATSAASLANPRTAADFARIRVQIDGNNGPESIHGFAVSTDTDAQYYQNITAAHSIVLSAIGSSITINSQLWVDGADWTDGTPNRVRLNALAIFRSTV